MQITRSGEYGLKGLIFLAKQPPQRVTLISEISRDEKIPETFLAKIFQRLTRAGLLRSMRGARGGFALGKPASEITIREIVEAIEGPIALNRCLLKHGQCEEEAACTLRPVWEEAQRHLLEVLERTTIDDLANRRLGNRGKEGGENR